MIGKIEELKEYAHVLEGWSEVLRDNEKTIKVDAIYHKNNRCSTVKAEMWFDFPAIDIWRVLHFHSLRSKWDFQSDIFDFKEKMGPGGFYVQSRCKAMGLIWARECMMNLLTYQDASDGTIYICFCTNKDL